MSERTLLQQLRAEVLPADGDRQEMYRRGREFLIAHNGEPGSQEAMTWFADYLKIGRNEDDGA